ncbi:hypothetical protein Rhal01_03375 [Rubritalea halochordaticola]|uniref:ABC transporter domain-containing protein n=1 Tax=Rubritalea halochordaticola TaxID=714537 RepID=A0ABP9V570_9BACT
MSKDAGIEIDEQLAIGYDGILAEVDERISLSVGNHYLLARNGRGKTTLLRSLAGVLPLRRGGFQIKGVRKFIPEDVFFNDHLPACAIFKAMLPKSRLEDCLAMAELIELDVRRSYRQLSTGNKRKVSLLVAEYSCDDSGDWVLLLDEPFTGLDSFTREAFLEYWDRTSDEVCRLVSCHPDFDSMSISSALLISDGKLTAVSDKEGQKWSDLKTRLH